MSINAQRARVFLAVALLTSSSAATAAGFVEEIVSFSTHDDLELSGIVSYPNSDKGPFPAILMVAGSGVNDADVTIEEPLLEITRGRQKLFRNVARFLSRKGYVVLRYNKRGASFDHTADLPQLLLSSTFDDLVDDADRALESLLAHPMTDPSQVAIYGHSEGTMIAPVLARRRDDVDLLVMVGSVAGSFGQLLEYQLVDRVVQFLHGAADGNGDGFLTLEELDRLDGQFGTRSLFILNNTDILFGVDPAPDGSITVTAFNGNTDSDGDGLLQIESEIVPALHEKATRAIRGIETGTLGQYGASLLAQRPNRKIIAKVRSHLLFVQGVLDVQTPIEETLELIEKLDRKKRTNYDVLLFEQLGHSLSKPNDYYTGDGGLTVLDNPTLNAMKKKTVRRIWKEIRSVFRNLGDLSP